MTFLALVACWARVSSSSRADFNHRLPSFKLALFPRQRLTAALKPSRVSIVSTTEGGVGQHFFVYWVPSRRTYRFSSTTYAQRTLEEAPYSKTDVDLVVNTLAFHLPRLFQIQTHRLRRMQHQQIRAHPSRHLTPPASPRNINSACKQPTLSSFSNNEPHPGPASTINLVHFMGGITPPPPDPTTSPPSNSCAWHPNL